jgi:hypothetical protein
MYDATSTQKAKTVAEEVRVLGTAAAALVADVTDRIASTAMRIASEIA